MHVLLASRTFWPCVVTLQLAMKGYRCCVRNKSRASVADHRAAAPHLTITQWRPVKDGLRNAIDLVRLIRKEHGEHTLYYGTATPPLC